MIDQLPTPGEPEWLTHLDPSTVDKSPFPLGDILANSLYYPCSAFDGDPIRHLAGNFFSFVYVDYGKSSDDLAKELRHPVRRFRGYRIIARRLVADRELVPQGWNPRSLPEMAIDKETFDFYPKAPLARPHCSWMVFEREEDLPPSHGPGRFSLLYLCAEGVAAFSALYVANGFAPSAVAVIQPGCWWTGLGSSKGVFARLVLGNPAGKPSVLLYGGMGNADDYLRSGWPDYQRLVFQFEKTGRFKGHVSVWEATA